MALNLLVKRACRHVIYFRVPSRSRVGYLDAFISKTREDVASLCCTAACQVGNKSCVRSAAAAHDKREERALGVAARLILENKRGDLTIIRLWAFPGNMEDVERVFPFSHTCAGTLDSCVKWSGTLARLIGLVRRSSA